MTKTPYHRNARVKLPICIEKITGFIIYFPF
jgi:hypothetical protein